MSLTDMVIMPGSDYKDACNAIREKDGSTAEIKSGELGAKIRAISGGGSSDLARAIIERTITDISDDAVETIGAGAFSESDTLITANFPAARSVGYKGFFNCVALEAVNLPVATDIGQEAFVSCFGLSNINMPAAVTIGREAFSRCIYLTELVLPCVTTIEYGAFSTCSDLVTVDLSVATSIGGNAFESCGSLTALILRSEVMCVADSYPLAGTPIADGTGYIYVPSALLADYQADSVWDTSSAQFRALEDYTVDGTTTGALDETKI